MKKGLKNPPTLWWCHNIGISLKYDFILTPPSFYFVTMSLKMTCFFMAFGSFPTTLQNIDPMSPAVGQWPDGAREGGAVQQGLALPPVHPHLLDQGQPQEPHPLRPPQVLHGETIRLSILRPELRHQAESAGGDRARIKQQEWSLAWNLGFWPV